MKNYDSKVIEKKSFNTGVEAIYIKDAQQGELNKQFPWAAYCWRWAAKILQEGDKPFLDCIVHALECSLKIEDQALQPPSLLKTFKVLHPKDTKLIQLDTITSALNALRKEDQEDITNQLTRLAETSSDVWLLAAAHYQTTENSQQAAFYYLKLYQATNNVSYLRQAALAYEKGQDFKHAASTWNELQKKTNDYLDCYRAAENFEKVEDYKSAAHSWNKCAEIAVEKKLDGTTIADLWQKAAMCFYYAGNYDDAAFCHDRQYEITKKECDQINAATCYEKSGKFAKAAVRWNQLAIETKDANYWRKAALAHGESKDNKSAETCWNNAIDKADAKQIISIYQDAAKFYKEIGKKRQYAYIMHQIYLRTKDPLDFKTVIEAYEKCDDLKTAANGLREFAKQIKQIDNKIICFKKAIELYQELNDQKNLAYIHQELAEVTHEKSDWLLAAHYFSKLKLTEKVEFCEKKAKTDSNCYPTKKNSYLFANNEKLESSSSKKRTYSSVSSESEKENVDKDHRHVKRPRYGSDSEGER